MVKGLVVGVSAEAGAIVIANNDAAIEKVAKLFIISSPAAHCEYANLRVPLSLLRQIRRQVRIAASQLTAGMGRKRR